MSDITKALAEVQKHIKAPKLRHNKFAGFDFRNTEDILQAVKPLLGDHVILLSDEIVLIGDRYYVKATVTFTDGKDVIERCGFAREADSKKGMDEAQVTGSASSYARKTALSGLLLLDDNRDADEGIVKEAPELTPEVQKEVDACLAAAQSAETQADIKALAAEAKKQGFIEHVHPTLTARYKELAP